MRIWFGNNFRYALMISLFIFGGVSAIMGVTEMLTAGNEFDANYFKEKGISLEPEMINVTKNSRSFGNTIPVNFINYTAFFETEDIFAHKNPFYYSIIVFVEDPDIIDRMVMFFFSEQDFTEADLLKFGNIDFYMDVWIDDNRAIELFNYSFNTFGKNGTLIPGLEQDIFLFLAIKQYDGALITSDKTEISFTLYPRIEKIQVDLIRITAEETMAEQKNNDIIRGLTWIILATIFLQPTFILLYKTS